MKGNDYPYQHGQQKLIGYRAYNPRQTGKRPAVLVVHDWSGRNDFACAKAEWLAELGYLGFAVDMYGEGKTGNTTEEKSALMQPLVSDRALLRDRLLAALTTLGQMPEVDSQRIAVIGFCFGGLCALDLARSGVELAGAVSFHGLLSAPDELPTRPVKAKILALHGYEDPMVRPEAVEAFCQEMTAAKADWQVHCYGNTYHAFTNPLAHDPKLGLFYNSLAERRAFQAMENFLTEVFTEN